MKKSSFYKSFFPLWACVLFFCFWSSVLSYKYHCLGYTDWDLALHSQTMWQLTQGSCFNSLLGCNFLANHLNFIAFLFVPIYKVFPSPLTLLFLKVLSYTIGAAVLYKISEKHNGPNVAKFLMLLYAIFPITIFSLSFEFHFESLAVGFLFLMFYFFEEENIAAFFIMAFLTASLKENMPLILITFGIYGFFAKKRKMVWGLALILLGISFFYLGVFVVAPFARKELLVPYVYSAQYQQIGVSSGGNFNFLNFDIFKIAKILFTKSNLSFFLKMFGPLFIALFRLDILFLGSPIILQNMLSSSFQQQTIYYHYTATVLPFIFIATIFALKKFSKVLKRRTYVILFLCILLLSAGRFLLYGVSVWFPRIKYWKNTDQLLKIVISNPPIQSNFQFNYLDYKKKLMKRVPKKVPVLATFEFLPEFSKRPFVYSFHNVFEGRNYLTGDSSFQLSNNVRYALINFYDRWMSIIVDRRGYERAYRFLEDNDWFVSEAFGDIVLFQKDDPEKVRLIERSLKSFLPKEENSGFFISEDFELLKCKTIQVPDNNKLALTFFWKSRSPVKDIYSMIFFIEGSDPTIVYPPRDIGYSVHPTLMWEEGEYIKEKYWLPLPDLKPGSYRLKAIIFNIKNSIISDIKNLKTNNVSKEIIVASFEIE
ncbi:MAG: DUF2079 domain-containing protein [Candidatus Aceula meridiana]|nr:DUF2079 domain-containing protein [Candidatus Aceula meridiana]